MNELEEVSYLTAQASSVSITGLDVVIAATRNTKLPIAVRLGALYLMRGNMLRYVEAMRRLCDAYRT